MTTYSIRILVAGFCLLTMSNESDGQCPLPSQNLVSQWSGEDSHIDGQGINNGAAVNGSGFAGGIIGRAFSFDGTSGYVSVPTSNSLEITGSITLQAWINGDTFSSPQSGNQRAIVTKWSGPINPGQRSYGLQIRLASGECGPNRAEFLISNTGDRGQNPKNIAAERDSVCSTTLFDDSPKTGAVGEWFHIAGTFDAPSRTARIYVNGRLEEEKSGIMFDELFDSSQDVWIGAIGAGSSSNPSGFFDGLIDEVAIHDRALSACEIGAIHAAGRSGECLPTCVPVTAGWGIAAMLVAMVAVTRARLAKNQSTHL